MKYWLRLITGIAALSSAILLPAKAQELRAYENVTTVLEHIKVGTRTRDVIYLRPIHPTTVGKVPALLLLEYLNGSASGMADLSEASALVRDTGAWVILPDSLNGHWNFGPTSLASVDDVQFLTTVIDSAIARFPIDPARIYMGGYSNGGHMIQRYACEHPEKIAAGAIISGSIHAVDAGRCHPSIGTPMIIFHGTADPVLPYNGSLLIESSLATAQLWAGFLGCSGQPVGFELPDSTDDGTTVHLDAYVGCSGTSGLAGVTHYTINNGGHTWPGSFSFSSKLGPTSQDILATQVLWQFVSQFSRPQ